MTRLTLGAGVVCALFTACGDLDAPPPAPAEPPAPAVAPPAAPARAAPARPDPSSVVGAQVEELTVDRWLQGEAELGGTQLVVFWELWCPHCRREVPRLEDWHARMSADGLQVIGLTRMSKGVTETQVRQFTEEQGLTYPLGIGTGELASELLVSGIPAAAVLVDGEVVWRGHPSRLTDDQLQGWLPGA